MQSCQRHRTESLALPQIKLNSSVEMDAFSLLMALGSLPRSNVSWGFEENTGVRFLQAGVLRASRRSAPDPQASYNSSALFDAFLPFNFLPISPTEGNVTGYSALYLSNLLVQASECFGPTWLDAMELINTSPEVGKCTHPAAGSVSPLLLGVTRAAPCR